jgi:hypothetical protein
MLLVQPGSRITSAPQVSQDWLKEWHGLFAVFFCSTIDGRDAGPTKFLRSCLLVSDRSYSLSVVQIRSRIGALFCLLALLQILGGHWALLQTSAWIGMVVQYSRQAGLKAGLAQTFDGEHPCPICKAIQDGKKQEQKKAPLLNAEVKMDYLAASDRFEFHYGWVELRYATSARQLQGIAFEPGVPPPRS